MKLENLQQLLFKTVTRSQEQDLSEALISPSSKLTASDRLDIYQNAYRQRLQEAIIDDFEASCELLGETQFENLFAEFCDTYFSNFKTLNGFTQLWLEFLGKKNVDPVIKDLTHFEWKMVETYYGHIIDEPQYPEYLLSENPRAAIRLDDSVRSLESTWPLTQIYQSKELRPEKKSFTVFWTEKNRIFYQSVSSQEYLLINLMSKKENMDDIFLDLNELGLSDESLAQFLQSSIASFIKHGFLLKV